MKEVLGLKAWIDELELILAKNEGVLDDKLEAHLDKIEETKKEKIQQLTGWLLSVDSEITQVKELIDRFNNRKKSLEKKKEFIRYLMSLLLESGEKQKTLFGSVSAKEDIKVEVEDIDALPAPFKKEVVKVQPSISEIKQHLKEGGEVPAGVKVENIKSVRFTPPRK